MPRGKKGPIPMSLEEFNNDPTAEEIVGAENVVDVGSPLSTDSTEERQALAYHCSWCRFESNLLAELEEHCAGTGHGRSSETPSQEVEPQQPELFSQRGIIHREVQVPLPDEVINEKRARLALLYRSSLEVKEQKRTTDADFNARLKNIDEQMQECDRVLRYAYTYERIDCEWRIIEGENARGLYRLDTGEMIEKSALTAEDMQAEREKALQQNEGGQEVVEAL